MIEVTNVTLKKTGSANMKRPDKTQTIVIILCITTLTLASVNLYNMIDRGNMAFIWGEVHSSYETEPIDVKVYIDGIEIQWYDGLEPGEIFTFVWMCEFSFFERTKSVEVKVVSIGESEPHVDSEFVSMKNLGSHHIDLYV